MAMAARYRRVLAFPNNNCHFVDGSKFCGWLAVAKIEEKCGTIDRERVKCPGLEKIMIKKKKDKKNLLNRRTIKTWEGGEGSPLCFTRHLHVFKILPNKVHNEFNSVPYGPEECSE